MADRIEIEIAADYTGGEAVSQAAADVNSLAGASQQAGESSSQTAGLMSDLAGAMAAVGAAAAVGALVAEAEALDQLGASSIRATTALNTLTGGHADTYLTALGDATNGVVDNMDGARIASEQLSLGLVTTADQSAKLSREAVILGETFGQKGAAQAIEDFDMMLSRGTTRGLYQYGISLAEVKAKVEELKQAHADLSSQQLTTMAIEEIAAQKADGLAGVLDDQKSHLEQLKDAWDDFRVKLGEGVAQGMDPIITNATKAMASINDMTAAHESAADAILRTSNSAEEANQRLAELYGTTEFNTLSVDEFTAAHVKAEIAFQTYEEGLKRVADNSRDAEDATHGVTDALNLSPEAYQKAIDAIELYDKEINIQAGHLLTAEQNVGKLTGLWWGAGEATRGSAKDINTLKDSLDKLVKSGGDTTKAMQDLNKAQETVAHGPGANMAKIFQFATGEMKNMNLSAADSLKMYNDLGLATGQVTSAQIAQGAALTGVDNLYAKHMIPDAQSYISALSQIPGVASAAGASLVAMQASASEAGQKAQATGSYMAATSMAVGSDLANAFNGTTESADKVQSQLDAISKSKTTINIDKQQADNANKAIADVQGALKSLNGSSATVYVNVVTVPSPGSIP